MNDMDAVLCFGYDIHLDFMSIHPFVDGNGRTARLLMNMWFLFALENINIIYFRNRSEYIKVLENSVKFREEYYDFMDTNFSEFKTEELELLENNEIYKY